ncbi:MAG: conjugal transfer protein TraR [Ignavibacteriaceae bacterium]|nr:conjugal transfer protein TraR [Ignavibacteriaceae bacterium]
MAAKKAVSKEKAKTKTAKPKKETKPKKTVKAAPKAKKAEKAVAKKTAAKVVPVKKTAVKVEKKPKAPVKAVKKIVQPVEEVKAAPKPPRKINGYGKADLEHFRQIIIAKQNEILEQLQNLRDQMMDPTTGEYINENSPYSLHMAEQGTDAMEREKTFLYAQRENKFLGYLEDALKRIDAGTYGICIECIDEPKYLCDTCPLVPKARLEAVPHSQLCLPIKLKQEKKRHH